MKITWTPAGGDAPITLGDDSVKYGIIIEQFGGASLEQREPLAGGANPAIFPRGNISGDFVFRSAQSYPDYPATFSQFATLFNYLNQQGTLLVTQGGVTLEMDNALLKGVTRLFDAEHSGVFMGIRYRFGMTTLISL